MAEQISQRVQELIERLKQKHEEICADLLDKEWSDEELNKIIEATENLASTDDFMGFFNTMSDATTKSFQKRLRYEQFQLFPQLAKLSFEEFNHYQDAADELNAQLMFKSANIIQQSLTPKLMDKLMPKEPWQQDTPEDDESA